MLSPLMRRHLHNHLYNRRYTGYTPRDLKVELGLFVRFLSFASRKVHAERIHAFLASQISSRLFASLATT